MKEIREDICEEIRKRYVKEICKDVTICVSLIMKVTVVCYDMWYDTCVGVSREALVYVGKRYRGWGLMLIEMLKVVLRQVNLFDKHLALNVRVVSRVEL